MTDSDASDALPDEDFPMPGAVNEETPERIADEVRDEIRLGHVEDDVSHVLEERFDEAGISLRPEEVDDLAEEIERDVST